MKYSQLFGKTSFGEQKGSDMESHQLLLRGGFIRESTAGRYFFLPLGWRVHEKIKAIIKEEMDKTGAQEMISPVLHPLELWRETNRTNTTGFELMKVKDRRGAEFALGGTAEEMFVDVVRRFHLTYKDLPINVYQFSTKFRDELRARGGLLRMREFVMKDAYSFARDEAEFKQQYESMWQAYLKIFSRMNLQAIPVLADNGYIGGEYCHEFQVEHDSGEGVFFVTEDTTYCAHEDVARIDKTIRDNKDGTFDEEQAMTEVEAIRGTTIEDGVKLHNLPVWQQLKSVLYVDNLGNYVLAVIRGDLNVNTTKLQKLAGGLPLRMATEEEIRNLGSEPGFISPVGFPQEVAGRPVKVVADDSLTDLKNTYTGANKLHRDLLNVNYSRDWEATIIGDITQAYEGAAAENGQVLRQRRGIEVGNIFQLGYHYTSLMKDGVFVDRDGKTKPYYMGCYGIGLGRTLATIVEKHHDDKGIIWPAQVAPFHVHLISLKGGEDKALALYDQLQKQGIEVLWDDRDESPGAKFADADLVGIPVRLVVSARTGDQVEFKRRNEQQSEVIDINEAIDRIKTK